jgi:ABC-type spermidine/putrescine transport system permease subunit I
LIPVAIVVAARVLLALAANGVVLGVSLVFFISLGGDHILEMGDGARAVMTEVFKGATVVEAVLEEVDDFLVGDIDYSGTFVEGAPHVLA